MAWNCYSDPDLRDDVGSGARTSGNQGDVGLTNRQRVEGHTRVSGSTGQGQRQILNAGCACQRNSAGVVGARGNCAAGGHVVDGHCIVSVQREGLQRGQLAGIQSDGSVQAQGVEVLGRIQCGELSSRQNRVGNAQLVGTRRATVQLRAGGKLAQDVVSQLDGIVGRTAGEGEVNRGVGSNAARYVEVELAGSSRSIYRLESSQGGSHSGVASAGDVQGGQGSTTVVRQGQLACTGRAGTGRNQIQRGDSNGVHINGQHVGGGANSIHRQLLAPSIFNVVAPLVASALTAFSATS